jgi:hypothetical protein
VKLIALKVRKYALFFNGGRIFKNKSYKDRNKMKSVEKMKKEFKRRLLPRCVRNP